MTLIQGIENKSYTIKNIASDDEEFNSFLFTLGCYSGESIILVSKKSNFLTVQIKDARYNIDSQLGQVIEVE